MQVALRSYKANNNQQINHDFKYSPFPLSKPNIVIEIEHTSFRHYINMILFFYRFNKSTKIRVSESAIQIDLVLCFIRQWFDTHVWVFEWDHFNMNRNIYIGRMNYLLLNGFLSSVCSHRNPIDVVWDQRSDFLKHGACALASIIIILARSKCMFSNNKQII